MKLSTVTLILRGYNFKQVDCVADVLLKSKYIRNLEVTLNTENALDIIEKIASKYSDNLNIGAGRSIIKIVSDHKYSKQYVSD